MSESEEREYQDPTTWEHGDNDRREPVKNTRAIVSVAFARSDFEFVAEAARREAMRTSEFIRTAAMERAEEQSKRAVVVSASATLQVRTQYPGTTLRVAHGVQLLHDPVLVKTC
jgi:hypothetical protein